MQHFTYGRPVPAMSNTERQRQFRKRNPGYYGRLHAKRRAESDARLYAMAMQQAQLAQLPAPVPLMLPAPVETFLFEDRATIPTLAELHHPRDAVLVEHAPR